MYLSDDCRHTTGPMINACMLHCLHVLLGFPPLSCSIGSTMMDSLTRNLPILYQRAGMMTIGTGSLAMNWNSTLSKPHSFLLVTVQLGNLHMAILMHNGSYTTRCTKLPTSSIGNCGRMRQRRELRNWSEHENLETYARQISRPQFYCNASRSRDDKRGRC